jgi:hypothetical protein
MLSKGWMVNVIAVAAAVLIAEVSRKVGRWASRLLFHAPPTSEYLRATQTIMGVSGAHESQIRMPHEKMRHAA